jgi:Toprim-like
MNLTDGLDSRGIRWRRSGKPNNIWLNCCFCEERGYTPDHRFRLGVNIVSGQAQCFNCGWKSAKMAVFELRRRLDLGDWIEAEPLNGNQKPDPVKLPKDYEIIDPSFDEYWNRKALRLCRNKGVTDWQISKYQIGVSVTGKYAGRIIIPIYWLGKLTGLVTRAIRNDLEPKYKNSVGDKALFGCPKKQTSHSCILTEGCFDAMACERVVGKEHDCLALLGSSVSDKQLKLLEHYSTYTLWPDCDQGGIEGFTRIANRLQGQVKIVMPPKNGNTRDPDEIGPGAVSLRIRKAQEWSPEVESRLKAWLTYQDTWGDL